MSSCDCDFVGAAFFAGGAAVAGTTMPSPVLEFHPTQSAATAAAASSTDAMGVRVGAGQAAADMAAAVAAGSQVEPVLTGSSHAAPPAVAWAAAMQQRAVDGLARAQIMALRLRLRSAVRRTEATRVLPARQPTAA